MTTPPTGTVTFLFTDIEGSTKLARENPDRWETMRTRHDSILRGAIESNHGHIFQIIGDAFCATFATAIDGVRAAIESQRKLRNENWGNTPVKVRMGLHTGAAEIQESGDYHGYLSLSRVQRLMSAGHGGQILISHATQELVQDELPNDVSLRDMGERRLKDLIRPEHIYQLDGAGLPKDFPALKTLDIYRHNLPVQLTRFIGREKEIAEVKQALAEHHLVTLTGSGGAGKTRLSLQVAADLLDQFPNGTWFVELAPITDPELIPQTILSAADMQTQQGRSALESLTDFLREKTSLIVLDNCEHLIEACAKLAETLLTAAPSLKILASSREALGVKGEQAWHIPSLSIPDLKNLPPVEQLSQYEAVRLFIDRALLVQPHFAVTNDNAPAVAQICSRLDGIPLAIELAAARVKVLKAEQISERLNDRFRLLTGGSRTALPRQQTLRALIDWSYDLLAENEKLLLRRLAVFMGGWTLEAAEQVCSDDRLHTDDILDLLTHLVDKSLVVTDEHPAQIRYRILETVRQYAREKLLESGEGEKLHTQHLAYFLKFAEEAEPHLVRKEQLEWLDRLEFDHENLRAALEWAVESESSVTPEVRLRLVNALKFFWQMRGYWVEGKGWSSRILENDQNISHTIACARAFTSAALFAAGDSKEVIKLCDKGLALGRELGDKPSIAESLLLKGVEIRNSEDNLKGRALLQESLSIFLELDDRRGMARANYNIGHTASNEYDFETAHQYYEECLSLSRDVGDRRFTAIALMELGGLFVNRGDLSAAKTLTEESLSLGRELGDKNGVAMYLGSLGEIAFGQGDFGEAEELLAESLSISRELGDVWRVLGALADLGRLDCFRGNFERGQIWAKECLSVATIHGGNDFIAFALYLLGETARLQSDFNTARINYFGSLRIAGENNLQHVIAYLFEELAALNAAQNQAKRSATLFGAAEALREAIHIVMLPVERVEVDKNIAAARAQLDEATFNAAWAEGQAMTMEQAIAYALEDTQ